MITQIKICIAEKEANEWLNEHPNYIIKDIKYNYNSVDNIMIIYEKSEQSFKETYERTTDKNIEYLQKGEIKSV